MSRERDMVRQMAAVLLDAIATEERLADRLAVLSREAVATGADLFGNSILSVSEAHRQAAAENRARLVAIIGSDGASYGIESIGGA